MHAVWIGKCDFTLWITNERYRWYPSRSNDVDCDQLWKRTTKSILLWTTWFCWTGTYLESSLTHFVSFGYRLPRTKFCAYLNFVGSYSFDQQEFPYARLSQGQTIFEPAPPKNSVYLGPTGNGMGVLLLPPPNRKARVTPNPVVGSLNVVYTPSGSPDGSSDDDIDVADLSGTPIKFQSSSKFSQIEKITR